MMKLIDFSILFALILCPQLSSAAPIPGTSSSALTAPKLGIHQSKFGFRIHSKKSSWVQTAPPKKSRYIETVYRSPKMINKTRGTLTVRTDRLKKNMGIKKYVSRWIKEYPKYGYQVLGSKKFKSKKKKGYVIDLINSKKKHQLRQVIYLKNKVAVLMTCRDHRKSFKSSLKECNKIVKTFSWNRR